jgi:hypothetical protein
MAGMRKLLPLLVFVPFTVWSTHVALEHGLLGFATLALREPWGMQILLDLSIALTFVGVWIWRDARRHEVHPLPYVLLLPLLGSIAALAYLVRRSFVPAKVEAPAFGA